MSLGWTHVGDDYGVSVEDHHHDEEEDGRQGDVALAKPHADGIFGKFNLHAVVFVAWCDAAKVLSWKASIS